jgi:hypothetical protein
MQSDVACLLILSNWLTPLDFLLKYDLTFSKLSRQGKKALSLPFFYCQLFKNLNHVKEIYNLLYFL